MKPQRATGPTQDAIYGRNGLVDRQGWIEQYAPLVKRIAHHMMARLPASVEVDDIIQAGMMGLLDAVNRYEEAQGAQFETYAVQRIRGAILDELRGSDWLPRSARRNMRRIETAINALEQRQRRAPTEKEVAEQFLERRGGDTHPGALDNLIDGEMREQLAAAIEELPEREKLMMSLYYERELNLREIGDVLGVSESRVCQLHTQAIARLRTKIAAR